jgi:hypothetical protein
VGQMWNKCGTHVDNCLQTDPCVKPPSLLLVQIQAIVSSVTVECENNVNDKQREVTRATDGAHR